MIGLFSKETRARIAVTPAELRVVRWAGAYFFFVLAGYSILRPLREQMGVAGGVRNLPYLFLATLCVMLIANPIYGRLVSRLPRDRFIPLVYRFFMLNLLVFYGCMFVGLDIWLARIFFVWVSVFNLFVVAVFWSFMADNFGSDAAKRLYAWIAVGGTLGSIVGSLLTWGWIAVLGGYEVWLMLVSVILLEMAVQCVKRLTRILGGDGLRPRVTEATRPLGGSAFQGLAQVVRSPYLLRICLYLLGYTITGSLLYFMQAQIVAGHFATRADQTQAFALIDLATQVTTLVVQVCVTRRLIASVGLGRTLGVLPIIAGLGFVAVAAAPVFWVIVVVQMLRRAARYAVSKPAREVLFSVVPRSEKYKAKAVIDTFVYRTGDVVGAGAYKLVGVFSATLGAVAAVALPVSAAWALVALSLGRAQAARAGARRDERP